MNRKFRLKTFYSLLFLAIYLLFIIHFFYSLQERIDQKDNFTLFFRIVMIFVYGIQIPDHIRRIRIYWNMYFVQVQRKYKIKSSL